MLNPGLTLLYLFSSLGLIVVLSRFRRASGFFIVSIYSLACAITLGSIFQSFYPSYVCLLSLAIFLGIVFGLRVQGLDLACSDKWKLFLLCLVYFSFFSFQVLEGFLGGQDGRSGYLPMSRLLSQEPNLSLERCLEVLPRFGGYVGYPPTITGMGALLFSVSGTTAEELAGLTPAVFFIGFVMLLLRWCEEEGVSAVFPACLLFVSPFFIERMSWFGYEAPLVFGATLLAYGMWKFSRGNDEQYLFYAMMGSALALMSKYTGVFFTLLLMYYILMWKRADKRVWGIFFLIHLAPTLWYLRNVYYFGSPIPPFLYSLIYSQFRTDWGALWLLEYEAFHVFSRNKWLMDIALCFISIPFLLPWAMVFPFTTLRKDVVYRGLYLLFCVFFLFWLNHTPPDMRFLMPFYGMALVHLSILIQGTIEQKIPTTWNLTRLNQGVIVFTLFLSDLCGQYIYTRYIFPDHISPALRAMRFLAEKEHAGTGTRVFTDTDHILAWRAGWVVFEPGTPKFAPGFLKAREQRDFYGLMRRYSVQYVINHPWNSPWEGDVFTAIEKDGQHFKKLYEDTTGVKVWRVINE